jgi:hypothetical protein
MVLSLVLGVIAVVLYHTLGPVGPKWWVYGRIVVALVVLGVGTLCVFRWAALWFRPSYAGYFSIGIPALFVGSTYPLVMSKWGDQKWLKRLRAIITAVFFTFGTFWVTLGW